MKNMSKIRLGYISGNFADHPVGHMTVSLLQNHNRKQFEVFAYSYGINDHSKCRKNIEKIADKFIDLNNFSNPEAAEKIRLDKIDILIDLMGWTEGNRLEILAMKPAKIQINWSELLGTSGASFYNYIIVDKIVAPPSEQKFYTEKFAYLPGCFYLRKNAGLIPKKTFTRSDFSLPNNAIVFGIFHQMFKIEPTVWSIWMNILKTVPNGVLWLWEQNKEGSANLRKYAKIAGVNPKRLIFAPTMSTEDFFARLTLADIALDTFIYGGGITTYQALAAGVPVISLRGTHMASRLGASILTKTGLPELITQNPQEYEDLAVELAQNLNKITKIKSLLTPKKLKNTLLNTTQTIRDLEEVCAKMYKRG